MQGNVTLPKSWKYAALLLILLLAAATRIHQIDERSLWEDEGWTLLLSEGHAAEIVQTMAYDQHPPLYFVMIGYWRDVTGESELALRSLSVLLSLLSVAAIYELGRVLFNQVTGLSAALLLAIWDFSIDVAQDARQYTLLTVLVILACTFYFRYLQRPTRWHGLGWLLMSIAALYTQYMAGIVLAVQGLHMLLCVPRRRWPDLILRFAAIGLAFLPWLVVFIRQNQVRWDDPIYYQSGLPNNTATFILIRDALVSQQFGLIIGLCLLGLVFLRYQPLHISLRPIRSTLFLLLWSVIYIGLLVYLNESREILRIRIFMAVMPALLLLVAHGLANLQAVPRTFLLSVLVLVNLGTIDTRQNNAPWREVVGQVTAFHQPGEPVLMDIWVGDFPARYYIERQMGAETSWLSLRELSATARANFLPQLVHYVEDREAFWLLRWNDEPKDYDDLLRQVGFQRTAAPYIEHEGNQLYALRYDRLTEERLATFGETIDLIKAGVNGTVQAGETITVTLWWTARQPPPVDYSISIRLLDTQGNLIANQDSPPMQGQAPTSTWQPGVIQYDQHRLTLPAALTPGTYIIGVSVYWYVEPDAPLAVQSDQDGVAQDGYARISQLTIE